MHVIKLLNRCLINIYISGLSCKNEDQYLLDRKLSVSAQYTTNDREQSDEEGLVNAASEEHNDMLSYLDNADLNHYSHLKTKTSKTANLHKSLVKTDLRVLFKKVLSSGLPNHQECED